MNTPAKRVLYNNLEKNNDLALAVHENVIKYRPDGWRGNDAKEKVIKRKLYEVLKDVDEVERMFPIIFDETNNCQLK
jgi:type I restriction enzyme R subunit